MKFITFPKQYFVGLRENSEHEKDCLKLGFATPFGTDAAFEKRKETVENWAKGYGWGDKGNPEFFTFDNVPTSGFSVETTVSRSSTDNKVMQLNDPRGFRFEISMYNFTDILMNTLIDHGKIEGKFVYGRDGNMNRLLFAHDPLYLESLMEKEAYTPQIGDLVETQNAKGVYVGMFYISRLCQIDRNDFNKEKQRHGYYYHKPDDVNAICYLKKPWIVIDERVDGRTWGSWHFLRTWPKKMVVLQKGYQTETRVKPNVFDRDSQHIFHNTEEEQTSFTMTEKEIRDFYAWKRAKADRHSTYWLDREDKAPIVLDVKYEDKKRRYI